MGLGLGFRVWGLGKKTRKTIHRFKFGIWGLGFRDGAYRFKFGIWGLGFRGGALGIRVQGFPIRGSKFEGLSISDGRFLEARKLGGVTQDSCRGSQYQRPVLVHLKIRCRTAIKTQKSPITVTITHGVPGLKAFRNSLFFRP